MFSQDHKAIILENTDANCIVNVLTIFEDQKVIFLPEAFPASCRSALTNLWQLDLLPLLVRPGGCERQGLPVHYFLLAQLGRVRRVAGLGFAARWSLRCRPYFRHPWQGR